MLGCVSEETERELKRSVRSSDSGRKGGAVLMRPSSVPINQESHEALRICGRIRNIR